MRASKENTFWPVTITLLIASVCLSFQGCGQQQALSPDKGPEPGLKLQQTLPREDGLQPGSQPPETFSPGNGSETGAQLQETLSPEEDAEPGSQQQETVSPEKGSERDDQLQFTDPRVLQEAFRTGQGNLQVTQQGKVIRILADDNEGSRHQRFIVKLTTGQTLLIAHNIDIAPRIPGLAAGATVVFHGVYEWNDKGGVIHWTHHDPNGQHEAGWIAHQGWVYQ